MLIDVEATRTFLDDLLHGRNGEELGDELPGAELVVYESAREVFRAALARHYRNDGSVFWVRPIGAPEIDPDTGLPVFDLQVNRRRALEVAEARAEGERIGLTLASGQTVVVQPAAGSQLVALAAYDAWMATLPAHVAARIDQLTDDFETA